MKTISVGVIGWGFMGITHTQALRSIGLFYPGIDFEIRLRCICTRRIEKAREAMRVAGFETCTDDYRELLAMEDIDGGLIGGAALKADDFVKLVEACL